MARPQTSPEARLRQLAAAKDRAGRLKRGETLTARPMADLLKISWGHLRTWCDDIPGFDESGSFERGSEGIEWTFRPVKTINFLIKHFVREQKGRRNRARRTREIVGGRGLDQVAEDYSLEELAKMLRLSIEFQDAKVRSGQFVNKREVMNILHRIFPDMLQAGLTAAQLADPNGQWSPAEREAAETITRTILSAQEKVIQRDLEKLSGGAA